LETTFANQSGKIMLTDFMSVTSEENKRRQLWPEHELVKQIKCESDGVEVIIEFNPRLDYGRVAPKIRNTGKLGWRIDIGTVFFTLRSDVDLDRKSTRLNSSHRT